MSEFQTILAILADGKALTTQQSVSAFDAIMSGKAEIAQIAAFLMALRVRGEHVDEIEGGAQILRSKALKFSAPDGIVDTCGTGGDEIGTYNISTVSAIIAAAAGVPVAKHGNRSVSSKSGSSEVLTSLGANLDLPLQANEQSLRENGFAFMFAPAHHQAMRHVGPVRAAMKLRTIFNLLGPLANPASAKRQILGVFDRKWLVPMAEVLKRLGSQHVWVVHGSDGLDEITTTGTTYVAELKDGHISKFEVHPKDVGLPVSTIETLIGGDCDYNADAIRRLLDGEKSAYRDIAVLNTGAALLVGSKASSLENGVRLAEHAVDSGAAKTTLERWIAFTQSHGKNNGQ